MRLISLIAVLLAVGSIYLIAVNKIKPTKKVLLFNNIIILIYLLFLAIKFFGA